MGVTVFRFPGAVARLAVLLAAAGCSFERRPLAPASGGIDAGAGGTADAASPGIDAPPAVDAAVVPDGAACPARERELQLGVLEQGTAGGQSRYEASCAGGPTGPEAFYALDVEAGARVDLVIDVPGGQPTIDTVLELSPGCSAAGALCSSRGRPGAGEVVVEELVAPGRRYLVVDTLSGSGPFSVTAFLRGVVASGALCSFDLTTSRCERGEHCVSGDDDAGPSCGPLPAFEDGPDNDTACTASRVLGADGVFAGVIDPGSDVDVIALEPPTDRPLRALVHDGAGGCPADLVLELLEGESCGAATVTASNDDGGPGPCPLLDATLTGGRRAWLRVRVAQGAPSAAGAAYLLVVDM